MPVLILHRYRRELYELNARYSWSKFIIVVPSVAIHEGVYKSLQATQEHFAEDYRKKLRFSSSKEKDIKDYWGTIDRLSATI